MRRLDRYEQAGRNRLRFAFCCDWVDALDCDRFRNKPVRVLAKQDLIRSRVLLQARCDVDCVARHEFLPDGRVASDDLTGVQANAKRHCGAKATLHLPAEESETVAHLGRRAHRAECIVLMRERQAEHCHDGVADELFDGAAVTLDGLAGRAEVLPHDAADRFGIQLLGECSGAGDVGEEHGHRLPDLVFSRRGEWRTAEIAEARILADIAAAVGAYRHGDSL